MEGLPNFLSDIGVTHAIITGDLTTTSTKKEYAIARRFVDQLIEKNIRCFVIPGNHDHYTQSAFRKKIFYQYFPRQFSDEFSNFNLEKDQVTAVKLEGKFFLVALDTTLSTPIFYSTGLFSSIAEQSLIQILSQLPADAHVILANHFPLFQHEQLRRVMWRARALQNILKQFPTVKLYLHGHTHRHCLADLRESALPVILDSGSISHYRLGTFNIIDAENDSCTIRVYRYSDQFSYNTWNETDHERLQF